MKKFGIIIAIEEYSTAVVPELAKIEFAVNDAVSIKKAFNEQLYIEDEELLFLTNEQSNKAAIEKGLSNIFSRIGIEDELYFYYAGHGFNAGSQNRITCWDTDNSNLVETSLSIYEILLKPLSDSKIKKSFIFIDSSAEELKSKNKMKTAANNLVEKEYSELVRKSPGHSFFLSCYPGEQSFASAQTKHGIWALQLLNAMNGKDDSAIDKANAITNISLGKFLSAKVPQYITKTMFINDRQSPYSVIDLSYATPIIAFESDDEEENRNVEIQFNQYVLSREQHIPFKNFEGFNKARHKVPKDHNSYASKMATELAQEEFFKVEIEGLFDKARKTLRLKNSNTVKDPEGGSLHTEFFRYNISADQSKADCSEITITRELELRVPLKNFPMPIDEIFTEGFDTITFPIKGTLDADALEDALYDLEDENQGSFENKDNAFSFFPKNIKGIAKVEISKSTLKIRFTSSQTSVSEILDYTQQTLVIMAATLKNLLS
ncbi:MAG: caspase family protein [Bacteriovorax sp.]|nr:caspase family protein [Bacteriovorax sp.]